MGSMTDIAQALRVTQTDFFTAQNGNRADVDDIVVLITDGDQTGGTEKPDEVAQELRNQGRSAREILFAGLTESWVP